MKRFYPIIVLFAIFVACAHHKNNDIGKLNNNNSSVNTNPINYNAIVGKQFNNVKLHSSYTDSVDFKEVISTDRFFVLYFSKGACINCIDAAFKTIEEISKDRKLKMIFLTDYLDDRMIYSLMKMHNMDYPYYGLNGSNLGFNANELNGPFLFVINKLMIVQSVLFTVDASNKQYADFFSCNL